MSPLQHDPELEPLSVRRARGKTARERRSLPDLGVLPSTRADRDALAIVLDQDTDRVPELVPLRHGRMAASPWTYYRVAAAVMAADLAAAPNRGIEVQLCGDAHVLNFGLWAPPAAEVLARAHARTGDPATIAGYIGKGARFDEAIGAFARAYADQTERDHRQLVDAIARGTIASEIG